MAAEDKRKELYVELKSLDDELKQLNAKLETVDEQISELNDNKTILNDFLKLKPGDEMKVPLTSGVYVTASLKDLKSLLVNVGMGVTVEKTPKEVIKIFDNQISELLEFREKLVSTMKELITRVEEIQKEFTD